MNHRSDEMTRLEDLLRSVRGEVAYPTVPDVRGPVRSRLQITGTVARSSELAGSTDAPRTGGPGESPPSEPPAPAKLDKSLRRQLLEMATATLVVVIFTGLLALVYRDQSSQQDGAAPGAEDPTEEAVADDPTGEGDETGERIPAIAYSTEVDGESILLIVDVQGNVLREVRDLPQHWWGFQRSRILAAVSPGGTHVVFEGGVSDRGNLHIREIPDGEDRPLTAESRIRDSNPVWSPDGEWIAFERKENDHTEIFVIRPDGSDLRQLTQTEEGAGVPVWSPDGERIAFLSPPSWEALGYEDDIDPALTPFAIHVVNLEGTWQRPIEDAAVADPPNFVAPMAQSSSGVWSPDGERIVFTVWEAHVDRDGASPRLAITDVESGSIDVVPDMFAISPAWSPDGNQIAFAAQEERDSASIFLYDLESGDVNRLVEYNDWLGNPQWSPDGEYLKYATDEGTFVVPADGGEPRLVAESADQASINTWIMVPASGESTSASDDRLETFLADATPVYNLASRDPPYPVPDTCPVTEMRGPYQHGSDDFAAGFWWIGSGMYAAHRDTVFFEGANPLYIQADSSVSVNADLSARGQRLNAESDAIPYLWVQNAAGQGTHRTFLRFPEPGCWEIELVSREGDSLEATTYAFPAFERPISAANNLIVTLGSTNELNLHPADDLTNVAVEVALNRPDVPEVETTTLERALELFWLEDTAGEIYQVDLARTLEVSGLDSSESDRKVPVIDDDGPLALTVVFTVPEDVADHYLIIKMPEDHPDPSLPDVYRVGLDVLRERNSDAIIPSEEPMPNPDLAIVYSRMVSEEAALIFSDPGGNVLQEVRDLPQHQWGPEVFRIESAISPAGTQVVFEDSGSDRGNLYIRDLPDGEDRPLVVESGTQDSNPVWSPDGEWIAFERTTNDHTEIYLIRPDGSDLRQLTETEEGAGVPVWSPDSQQIAFVSPPSWEALGYVLDANPAETTPFAIHVVNADGTEQRAIPGADIFEPQMFAPPGDPGSAQAWSPDSRHIVFTVWEAHVDRDGASPRLAIADIESDSIEVIPELFAIWPAWSPSGEQIAFTAQETSDSASIFRYDVASGDVTLSVEYDDWLGNPQWSPDGEYLKYVTDEGVYVVAADGGEPDLIAESVLPWPSSTWVMLPARE